MKFIAFASKAKRFTFYGFLHFFLSCLFLNISEFGAEKYFTDHQSLNTIQLFVAIKRNFSGPFFS